MEKTNRRKVFIFHLPGMAILALSCAALAAGQISISGAIAQSSATHPQIAGIRVGPHVTVSGPGPDFPSSNGYCDMDILADEHTTVFPPGTLPGQTDYLFFVTAAPYANTVTDASTNFRSQTSGMVVLSSSGPAGGQWALDFAPGFGKYSSTRDGASTARNTNLCQTHGQVLRTPVLHNVCPSFVNGVGNATFDLTYAGPGSVLIDPTNLGPRELLAVYNGNNNCIGHDGNPKNSEDEMTGYYTTTGVATSDDYGQSWPVYRTNYQLYPGETPAAPNAPEGASGADVCGSDLDETCSPAKNASGIYFGRQPALTPSLTVEEAVAAGARLKYTIGSQEPSAFIDDVQASLTSSASDIYLYTVQISACASIYCPASTPGNQGTISVARAKLNGGTGPLDFTRWYGPSASYNSYINGTAGASFNLQTTYALNTPFTNAGTGYNGGSPAHGGIDSPIFPMDNTNSATSYRTCQAGGTGGDNDQRQGMGSISYVPATKQYLLTFVCSSPSDPSQPVPTHFDATQKGAAIFYSTLDAGLYDLSRQDKWSPPQEVAGSWEPFTPDRRICSNDHKLCANDADCAPIAGGTVQNICALPSASDCLTPAIQRASQDPNDSADTGCDLDRYSGWYPSFMSTGKNTDPTHPTNPSYLSTSADGYIFSMEGCLGPTCREFPRVYNSRQYWIDVTNVPAPSIAVTPTSLQFTYTVGGTVSLAQSIQITNSGGGTLSWAASPSATWVGLSAASGTAPATLSVSVSPTNLAAGSYSATVLIIAAGATGSPVSISVSLVVQAPQPNITAVANGASYQAGFASATWVSIFGTDLSQTTRLWQNNDFVNGLLPTSLSGVSATINGRAAYVEYISPTQVNVLAPDDSTVGPVPTQVTTAQGKSNSFTAQKQQFAPGFFTIAGNYVAAQHADYSYVGKPGLLAGATTQPAKPGETILIYGTGFGPTSPPVSSSQLVTAAAILANSVQFTIGGVAAPVAYAGLVGAGLYQFNVTVPNVPSGDAAVVAKIGGVQTQTGVLITIQQ
jgi:uncharacterized protein (TIGR03437 family)